MSVPEYLLAVSISFDEQFRDTSEIKIKYINVNCDQNDCICKSKRFRKFEDNLKYAFLDPKDSN
ncbi:hypothetical protein RhiirA5_413506 [Rhizophagus irregularis]|uniref:Uncharacterized protein n=1 Tax=Rhizophagus irregularis TaxID=588596 RepID=A0A2I1EGA3_9GLOM|nr:hypothetical protein RhiirA5_413506 [Rhizophagus irregularis]PKK64225.1 hypothetical protein RhiirC2_787813 [Rhizophagus irregularis]PKY21158.1 hypothetical protein RhiirB3_434669 [Rhizophagus irregularis]